MPSYSCSKKKSQYLASSIINVDNKFVKDVQDISSHIDELKVIKIQESQGSFLGDVFDIKTSVNNDYLFYDFQTGKISIFDSKGSFIKILSKNGDGPSDLLKTSNFWINEKKEIEVYDFAQMKVISFDSTYNFKSFVKGKVFNHFNNLYKIPHSENYVGYADYNMFNDPINGSQFHIAILDKKLDVVHTEDIFDKTFSGLLLLTYKNHFLQFGDSLRYIKAFDNNVYSVSPSGLTSRYKISYLNNPLPDDIDDIIKSNLKLLKNRNANSRTARSLVFKNYTRLYEEWLEGKDYAYFSSIHYKNDLPHLFYSIYSKKENRVIYISKNFSDTIRYKMILPTFQFFDSRNNELLSLINGIDLKKNLLPGSQLESTIDYNPEITYLVKLKLK